VLVVVFIVRVDEPEPLIEGGLKPPLVMPLVNPDSLPTLRLTGPLKPLSGVTVTVKVADWPGTTDTADGLIVMEYSGDCGSTVIVRVGGLGSELPLMSITVSDVTYVPAVLNTTLPGACATEVAGDPPGNTHEYLAAAVPVLKETDPPAVIVVSEAGDAIVPVGGDVA
jgi:hypothetical protein